MKKFLIFALIAILAVGCTQPDKVKQILEADGYTQIQVGGYAVFGCSDDDTFRTRFTAVKNGKAVSGQVCAGFLKGSTIRVD